MFAQGPIYQSTDRQTLKGLPAFYVLVDVVPELSGVLTTEQIQTDVELRLRKAGIQVATQTATRSLTTYLYVQINGTKLNGSAAGLVTYDLHIGLNQLASLPRMPDKFVVVETWSISAIGWSGIVNATKGIREQVGDYIDKFANAYLSVNPK